MVGATNISHNFKKVLQGDRQIWMILFVLAILSIPVVLSSIHMLADKYDTSPLVFLGQHCRNVCIAILIAFICHRIPSKYYNKIAMVLYAIAVLLLIYTDLFAGELNEARRWIRIPLVGLSFQPSDFAKVALIVLLAQRISSNQLTIKNMKKAFKPIYLPTMIIIFLIMIFDLSTALLLCVAIFAMMFVGRMNVGIIFGLALLASLAIAGISQFGSKYDVGMRSKTWSSRVEHFLNRGESARPDQVLWRNQAISRGGLMGVGPGKGLNKNYFNSPFTDFIFAVICEEYGLLGGGFVVFLYLWFFWRVTIMVINSNRAFGALLAFGLAFMIVLQAMINMMVTLDLLPSTGIPLPMISLGGTSNMITGAAFGIILSISRDYRNQKNKLENEADEHHT
jgi:cell division protein FtsW